MFVIIPLGGIGDRFKKAGYKYPKALINIYGKPILYYLLDCINLSNIDFIYIPYNKEYEHYRFEDKLKKDYPKIIFKFLKLENNTEGAAETINIALKNIDIPDCPVLCLDGDNFYSIDIISIWNGMNKIITFEDTYDNPIYSYIKLDSSNNNIIDIVEKQKISNHACSGAYGFNSYKQLLYYSQEILDKKIKQKGEYYMSNVIRQMIYDNSCFTNETIDINKWYCLGTPLQLKQFYNNYNSKQFKKLRLCFDFDNTLVTYPKIKNDYTTVEPIEKNIDFLKYMKTFGHTIIIYTARRMNTHSGNTGKVLCDIGKITFDTIEKFKIPFDEIYFGKPYADVYIDDLALNCFDDMEKDLGYYMDKILPRSFNQLETNILELYLKRSNDLSGEIYYYKNIPYNLKNLFPLFIDYDKDNKWYKIEKINGLTISTLYLSELLTCETLKYIMDSIQTIQKETIQKETINIYDNYCSKLNERYQNYDYSKFKNSNMIYQELYDKLLEYETNNKGIKTIIHGDPVFTNIILNNYNKIKFIDMRGKIGNILTIYGDWLYDWAKVYQSLIGYDKILQGKNIDINYENKMINYFKDYFISLYSEADFENLKTITKSLLFTLLPLHDDNKCLFYYDLIQKIK